MDELNTLQNIVNEHLVADKKTHIQAERLFEAIKNRLNELQADIDSLKKASD